MAEQKDDDSPRHGHAAPVYLALGGGGVPAVELLPLHPHAGAIDEFGRRSLGRVADVTVHWKT